MKRAGVHNTNNRTERTVTFDHTVNDSRYGAGTDLDETQGLNKSSVLPPDVSELKHDDVPPANKLIDFEKQMADLKARTELEVPYCMTQCEDAMYLGKQSVVSLEYQYYQNGCKYSKLKEITPTVAPNGKVFD